jgi:hypothetical protein
MAIMAIPKVCKASEYYMNKDFFHAKNERLYVATKKGIISNNFSILSLEKGRKNWCNLLLISTC